jgi:adenosylcobinamide-GDP ribazoletransferase
MLGYRERCDMRGLLTAVSFLSVLPVPYRELRPGDLGRAAVWFPAVGLVIGAALAGVDWAGRALWDPQVAAALVVGAALLLTGGLHMDGLMDTADAFFSRKDPARMLEIMRDSRAGALGVASGIVVLLTKFAAFAHLAGPGHWRTIVLVPVMGRLAMVVATALFGSARSLGLGASFAAETRPAHALLAVLVGAAAALVLLGWRGVLMVPLAVALSLSIGAYCQRRLGGLTGDIYGAVNETVEVAVLLAAPLVVII